MITQYPWASVKNQQRKHIEFGMMVTLFLAIITFYAVPEFGTPAPVVEEWVAPPIDVVKIPATRQEPIRQKPVPPQIAVPDENVIDMGQELPWDDGYDGVDIAFLVPPDIPIPPVPIWAVETPPTPIGGYAAILANIEYPEIAIQAGIEGTVIVEAIIGINGMVESVSVLEGVPRTGLNDAAMLAIMKTAFTPAYQRDKPVRVSLAIPIKFKLN